MNKLRSHLVYQFVREHQRVRERETMRLHRVTSAIMKLERKTIRDDARCIGRTQKERKKKKQQKENKKKDGVSHISDVMVKEIGHARLAVAILVGERKSVGTIHHFIRFVGFRPVRANNTIHPFWRICRL